MATQTTDSVRAYLLARYRGQIEGRGLPLDAVPDNLDLLGEGIIDSMGILELITDLEARFGQPIDFEALPAEQLTILGPLSRYVEQALQRPAVAAPIDGAPVPLNGRESSP